MTRGDDGCRLKPFGGDRLPCVFVGGPAHGREQRFPGGRMAIVPHYDADWSIRQAEYAYEQVIEHGVVVGFRAVFCAYSR
jgi:hypothetical protein